MARIKPDIVDNPFLLSVRLKTLYGRENIYPANETAAAIAAIAGTATLTPSVLRICKERLGYTIDVEESGAARVLDLIEGR